MASEDKNILVPSGPLREFVARSFEAAGVPTGEAAIIADSLVEADLRGVHSHGVMRTPVYVKRITTNSIAARAKLQPGLGIRVYGQRGRR